MNRFYCSLLRFVLLSTVVLLLPVLVLKLTNPVWMCEYLRRSYFQKGMLLSSKGDSSVILLGGSNVAYGFSSAILSDSLCRSVINASIGQPLGLKFMLDQVSCHLDSGDVLVLCPEYDNMFSDIAYGGSYLAEAYWSDASIRGDICYEQYCGIIKCLLGVPSLRLQVYFGIPHVEHVHGFNAYGDHDSHWFVPGESIAGVSLEDYATINHSFLDYYASKVSSWRSRGIEVVILPPAFARSSYDLVHDRIDSVRVELRLRDIDYMLDPTEFVYPDSLFFDSCYHLRYAGVLDRTHRVLTYLRPFVVP